MGSGVPVAALDNILSLKTPEDKIKWLPATQKKPSLAYIDARLVMDILDSSLVGPANWQAVYAFGPAEKVACGIGILVDYGDHSEWVWKWDGAGETDIEGEKGSFSDAFKRAAVRWGIGRDLYSMGPRAVQNAPHADAPAPVAPRSFQPPVAVPGGSEDGSVCPYHGTEWISGQYGYYCKNKAAPNGPSNAKGYCNAKPKQAWVARQETAQ